MSNMPRPPRAAAFPFLCRTKSCYNAPMSKAPQNLVNEFNDYISAQNLSGLAALMSDDHVFIDAAGTQARGKEEALKQWQSFFALYPDYHNHFERMQQVGDALVITGRSECPHEPALDGPALWAVRVSDGKILEWRAYNDTIENRTSLGIA